MIRRSRGELIRDGSRTLYRVGMAESRSWHTPVVIVGGGPVGLAMAIGLRHFFIECSEAGGAGVGGLSGAWCIVGV